MLELGVSPQLCHGRKTKAVDPEVGGSTDIIYLPPISAEERLGTLWALICTSPGEQEPRSSSAEPRAGFAFPLTGCAHGQTLSPCCHGSHTSPGSTGSFFPAVLSG